MKAAVFNAPFDLELTRRSALVPGPGEAPVQVEAAGLRGGDLQLYPGKSPCLTSPRVGGHEPAGRVLALGPEIDGPRLGTAFAVEPFFQSAQDGLRCRLK